MNDEDLETFKQRINKQELTRSRKVAIMYSIFVVVGLILIVYALFQREAMEVQYVKLAEEVSIYKKRAENAEQKLLRQDRKLEEALKAAGDCKQSNKRE